MTPSRLYLASLDDPHLRIPLEGWEARILYRLACCMQERGVATMRRGKGTFFWDEAEDVVRTWWELNDEPDFGPTARRWRDRPHTR